MDHSLWAYLKRLPVEQLEAFLQKYYAGELTEDYSSVIAYVEYLLECRGHE